MTKHVLFIGITGCIGGSVYNLIKSAYPDLAYTALIRNESHASAVRDAGADPVIGTFADLDLAARLAEEADIVINCADADTTPFHKAILEGLKKRKEAGKGVGILIHTSGSAVFLDGSKEGKLVEGGKVWNDGNIDDIKSIKPTMIHGQVDVPILEASARGEVHSYIIAPSAVHGQGTGPVGRTSVLAKMISTMFLADGKASVVGEGTNVAGAVHIADLAELYLLVFKYALSNNPPSNTPYERYFIASYEEISWGKVVEVYGKSLYRRGKVPSQVVVSKTFEEAGPAAGFVSGNCFTKQERGAALGWAPKGPSILETLEEDLDVIFSQQ